MKLSAVANSLGKEPFHGFDGTNTVQNVGYGSLQVYDRFISARSFGQKKRILYCGADGLIDSKYGVLTDQNGIDYVVTSVNYDYHDEEITGATYSITEASYWVDIITYQPSSTQTLGGFDVGVTESLTARVRADVERISAENSNASDPTFYSTHLVTMPGFASVTIDDELVIEGERYEVREVGRLMLAREVRCVKRG